MHDLRMPDAKTAAKRLRTALKDHNIDLGHGDCLDIVARQFGVKNWNVLAARLEAPAAAGIAAPAGWNLGGIHLASFAGGLDAEETLSGRRVFWLRNEAREPGHATLSQSVVGAPYLGKRVRFSGWLRTEAVEGVATLFLGACDSQGHYLAFTSLEHLQAEGALRGTTGWSQRALVLDIPAAAHSLTYGFSLVRTGEARFSGLDLRVVGPDVPLTRPQELEAPENLDFTAG